MRSAAWLVVVLFGVGAIGCPSGKPAEHPTAPRGARVAIARLEATRGGGVAELIERAGKGGSAERALALRALGRVGGPRAVAALVAATADPDPIVANHAAAAIGVTSSLAELPDKERARASKALVTALERSDVDARVVIEAIGRAGDAAALPVLAARAGSSDARIAEAAAHAIGRYGRRELAIDHLARGALSAAAASKEESVRRAAVWAMGREHREKDAKPDAAVTGALVAAIADTDAETRALAIAALARRKTVAAGSAMMEQALRDPDWRVAVEAVRALAGEAGLDAGRDAVATIVVRAYAQLEAGNAPAGTVHVVLEGLRALAASATRPLVKDALVAIQARAAKRVAAVRPLVAGWARCLATAALERAAPDQFDGNRVLQCSDDLPLAQRAAILGDALKAKVGTPAQRGAALVVLLAATEPPVRAAGLDALAAAWPDLAPKDREALVPAVTRGLAAEAQVESGTAAEAVGTLLGRTDLSAEARSQLAMALGARTARELDAPTDPELAGSLMAAIGGAKLASGRAACERGTRVASPVIRAAAQKCLAELAGGEAPKATLDEPAVVETPPMDVDRVIGRRVSWKVETTAGAFLVILEPDVAPWHVAAIATMTEKRFYDGLIFHRVVPDFVVQGGDPTGTGWGGPGFTLPAEPGARVDGDDYRAGAVGIADAGKDSGGSQWFVMHSRAPHLEGRYTRVGRVEMGQSSVDNLVVGDRIVKATIEIR